MNYKDTVNFQTNPNPRDAIPYTTGKNDDVRLFLQSATSIEGVIARINNQIDVALILVTSVVR